MVANLTEINNNNSNNNNNNNNNNRPTYTRYYVLHTQARARARTHATEIYSIEKLHRQRKDTMNSLDHH